MQERKWASYRLTNGWRSRQAERPLRGLNSAKRVRVNFAHVRAMWTDPDFGTVLRFAKNDELYVVESPPEIMKRLASRESKSLGF